MHSYSDSVGSTHEIRLTVGVVRRVLRDTQHNLANVATDLVGGQPLIVALQMNPDVLCRVLHALLPADGRPSEDEFADLLDGKTLGAGWEALLAELTDFFRDQGRREIVEAIETAGRMVAAAKQEAIERVREEERKTSPTTGAASTSSPVSAA
jgi:hypothetical protein